MESEIISLSVLSGLFATFTNTKRSAMYPRDVIPLTLYSSVSPAIFHVLYTSFSIHDSEPESHTDHPNDEYQRNYQLFRQSQTTN